MNRPVVDVPSPMSAPKKSGPKAPKSWAIAKNTAIASVRTSIGQVSLTLRYAALAPADAKKKMTIQMRVWDRAVRSPSWKCECARGRLQRRSCCAPSGCAHDVTPCAVITAWLGRRTTANDAAPSASATNAATP
jgi:hypothetical protein